METLRKFWSTYFQYNWKFGLALILLLGIPRFILVMQANMSSGGYGYVMVIFLMWFLPFIFLTKKGRFEIGIRRPNHIIKLLYSFFLGILSCTIIFGVFYLLYDTSINNAYVYMGKAAANPSGINDSD